METEAACATGITNTHNATTNIETTSNDALLMESPLVYYQKICITTMKLSSRHARAHNTYPSEVVRKIFIGMEKYGKEAGELYTIMMQITIWSSKNPITGMAK